MADLSLFLQAVNAKKDYEDDELKSSPPTETDLSCSNQVK